MTRNWRELREVAERAARSAGQLLRQMQHSVNVREKAPADLVTEADVAAQQMIRDLLLEQTPEFGFLGEEDAAGAARSLQNAEFCWIVDPLDGTTNYVHGLDSYCVSIALCQAGDPVLGVVFDPVRDELFAAVTRQGTLLNERPIHSSGQRQLDQALVAASFGTRVSRDSAEIARFVEVVERCQAVRRMGSAALNLGYVAAGRLDGYWATSAKAWDVAAGVLLIRQAGGIVTGMDGGPFRLEEPHLIAAASGDLHAELLEALARVPG